MMMAGISEIEKLKAGDDKPGQQSSANSPGLSGRAGSNMARRMFPPPPSRKRK